MRAILKVNRFNIYKLDVRYTEVVKYKRKTTS